MGHTRKPSVPHPTAGFGNCSLCLLVAVTCRSNPGFPQGLDLLQHQLDRFLGLVSVARTLSRWTLTSRSAYYEAINKDQRGGCDATAWVQLFARQ